MVSLFTNWDFVSWFSLGLILLIFELVLPGVFLLWFGIAALSTGAIVALFYYSFGELNIYIQIILMLVLSLLSCYIGFVKFRKHDNDKDSDLNRLDKRMIGSIGKVTEFDGVYGHAKFLDSIWKIKGDNLKVGNRVKVISIDNIILNVEKID